MKPLPNPEYESLLVRTNFDNDKAWASIDAAVREADFGELVLLVNDPEYAGMTVDDVLALLAAEARAVVFLADEESMRHKEHPLLVVDLNENPGDTFRAIPAAVPAIGANLDIANMDFAEFEDNLDDDDDIFRGF